MKALKILTIAVVVLLVAAAVQPVAASCGGPTLIGTNSGTTASFVWTEVGNWATPSYYTGYAPWANPPQPPWSALFAGQWWALGTGDPATGAGDDSDTWTVDNWAYYYVGGAPYYYYYAGEMFGGWGQSSEIDGCIVTSGQNCTCIALTDQDADNSFLALLGAAGDPNFTTWYDQPGTDGAGNGGPIKMQQLATPIVTNTAKNGAGVDVTIDFAAPTGLYMKDGCDCGAGLSYNIVSIELPQNSGPPTTRDPAAWTTISTGLTAVGTPGTATATCTSSPDVELYVSYELVFDPPSAGGMPSKVIAANSTRLVCGSNPTLADPVDVRPRVRPDAPVEQRRGGKSGGRKG